MLAVSKDVFHKGPSSRTRPRLPRYKVMLWVLTKVLPGTKLPHAISGSSQAPQEPDQNLNHAPHLEKCSSLTVVCRWWVGQVHASGYMGGQDGGAAPELWAASGSHLSLLLSVFLY